MGYDMVMKRGSYCTRQEKRRHIYYFCKCFLSHVGVSPQTQTVQ